MTSKVKGLVCVRWRQIALSQSPFARTRGIGRVPIHNLVEARLLLRAVVLAVNFIFHHTLQACVQFSRD
jgi:hypothetical protein